MDGEKDSTASKIILILAVGALPLGLAICFYSGFHCIELDFSEDQRKSCNAAASFIAVTGFSIMIGSLAYILHIVFNKTE